MKNKPEKNNDKWLYRMVVIVLGLIVAATIVSAIAVTMTGQSAPEVIVVLGSVAIGGLAGLLVPSPLYK